MGIRDIEILIEENNPEVPDPPDPAPNMQPLPGAPADDHLPPLDDIDDVKYLEPTDPRRQEIERWAQQPKDPEVADG